MFEMLIGYPPFCSDSNQETYKKIVNWKDSLLFPDDVHISSDAEHLIRRLLCNAEQRLGRHGAEEIKSHPFFKGVDWDNIRKMESPFRPELKSMTDTSYFPTEDLADIPDIENMDLEDGNTIGIQKDLAFVGYTFKRFDALARREAI